MAQLTTAIVESFDVMAVVSCAIIEPEFITVSKIVCWFRCVFVESFDVMAVVSCAIIKPEFIIISKIVCWFRWLFVESFDVMAVVSCAIIKPEFIIISTNYFGYGNKFWFNNRAAHHRHHIKWFNK